MAKNWQVINSKKCQIKCSLLNKATLGYPNKTFPSIRCFSLKRHLAERSDSIVEYIRILIWQAASILYI